MCLTRIPIIHRNRNVLHQEWRCDSRVIHFFSENAHGLHKVRRCSVVIRDLKHDDAFNKTWLPVLSIDKCCQVTSLSIERTDHHVLLKASYCLRCVLRTLGVNRSKMSAHRPGSWNTNLAFHYLVQTREQ